MKYSEIRQQWCVNPTQHTNLDDVIDWCHKTFGPWRVKDVQDGIWGWSNGHYYGLINADNLGHQWPDVRMYFAFDKQSDAMIFAMRWA